MRAENWWGPATRVLGEPVVVNIINGGGGGGDDDGDDGIPCSVVVGHHPFLVFLLSP